MQVLRWTALATMLASAATLSMRRTARPSALRLMATKADLGMENVRRFRVREVMDADEDILDKEVLIRGWCRTVRNQKSFAFIEVNDGSSVKGLQAVVDADVPTFGEVDKLSTGASVSIKGTVVESPGKGQKYEIKASEITVVGECPSDYPLQKKRHSLEFLRGIAHLRPRTNTISAASRVRSTLAGATHEFFQSNGFQYVQTPLITGSDCEGAGEMFRVTTVPEEVEKIPKTEDGKIDFSQDFFGAPTYLTVSGQLSGEAYATALGDIYTFGPTFRAENSQTTRHLAEFWMIEPEMAFAGLPEVMDNAEAYVKHVVTAAREKCAPDMEFFGSFVDKTLNERLTKIVEEPFERISYRDAVAALQKQIAKDPSKWQFPEVEFGTDLQTEHERWLCEKHAGGRATFVYDYPKSIKAFYMRENDDEETVAATDLLVPGVGELVGGSAREERLDVLVDKIKAMGLEEEDYWWYLDLRRYGSVPHAGYGLGFERLVQYATGIENIRDAIAFPRFAGSAKF
mmetsp:Transcript_6981/g.20402  ORF Transcript_6981/g.20402 Transcript_6981/m.20402 type:complete len:515 (-) Transcript_6981:125-1669(-)